MSSNWFSNFTPFPMPVVDNATGISYKTPEHLYQAMKTLDMEQRKAVAACATPGQAKRMGRKITMRPDWQTIKFDVMVYVQTKMCHLDPAYAERLKASPDDRLIEWNNWHDNIWGTCTCPKCADKPHENLLQKALIKVRDSL